MYSRFKALNPYRTGVSCVIEYCKSISLYM